MQLESEEAVKNGATYETDDELTAQGLFIDDLHRLRILDPSLADQTLRLKNECDSFVQATRRFDEVINAFKKEAVKLAEAVEIEKKRAIGYRLLLDTLKRKKENEQRQVMAEIDRKRVEYERLRMKLELLQKAEHFQQEVMDQFQMLH